MRRFFRIFAAKYAAFLDKMPHKIKLEMQQNDGKESDF